MKILYSIQGTGNGHLTRAIEIIPHLQKYGSVDILVSGSQWDISFPYKIKYRFNGMGFIFGQNGGVDVLKTYMKMNSLRMLREIKSLPVEKYDAIISDFEPVSCWAAYLAKLPCIGLSNQAVTLHPLAPKPKSIDPVGKLVLQYYAPVSANYGYHFKQFDNTVFTPIIRNEVRSEAISDKGYVTVYLPSYSDEKILKHLKNFSGTDFFVFSKNAQNNYREKNVRIQKIDNNGFLNNMANAHGIICNAGFGTASEALYLNKPLMVIPMKRQYEQQCNAAVLKSMGVTVVKKLKKKHHEKISSWLNKSEEIKVNYPDQTDKVIEKLMNDVPKIKFKSNMTDLDLNFNEDRNWFI